MIGSATRPVVGLSRVFLQFRSALGTQHSALLPRTPHSALIRLTLGFLTAAALAAGCGYQFQVEGPGPTIGKSEPAGPTPDSPTLTVAIFENRSVEPNLELKYTDYTRREFLNGTGLRVRRDPGPADLVLKGRILSVIIPTLAFDLTRTLESRVTVFVQGEVEKVQTGEVIWAQLVTASAEFFVTPDLNFNRLLQRRALERAGVFIAQDLAARFLNHLDVYGVNPPSVPQQQQAIPAGVEPGDMGGRR